MMADTITNAAAIPWSAIETELDNFGSAILKNVLSRADCEKLAAGYPDDGQFRKRIVMARHGFGRGEYKYFSYPLPGLVNDLRQSLYPPLGWNRQPLE